MISENRQSAVSHSPATATFRDTDVQGAAQQTARDETADEGKAGWVLVGTRIEANRIPSNCAACCTKEGLLGSEKEGGVRQKWPLQA
jgi:hypothetical protein